MTLSLHSMLEKNTLYGDLHIYFDFGTTLVLLWSLLCARESLWSVSADHMECQGLKLDQICTSILLAILNFQTNNKYCKSVWNLIQMLWKVLVWND